MRKKFICLMAFLMCGVLSLSACGFGGEPSTPPASEAPSGGSGQQTKPEEQKPDDGKPDDGKTDDGKPDDGKTDDGKPDDGKPDDGKPEDPPVKREPVIAADDISVQAGKYFDPMQGVMATGVYGEDIRPYVSVRGLADTSRAGTYELTYSATVDGKTATHVRRVTVTNNPAIGREESVFIYEAEESYNIARGCAASSTSEYGDAKASKAFDGDNGTRWESVHGVDEVTLTVDLGAVVPVEEVSILWEAAYAKQFDIQFSDDGEGFQTVHSEDNFTFRQGVAAVYSVNESARYIRLACHRRALDYGYSVYELSVFGKKGTVIPAERFPVLYDSEKSPITDEQEIVFDLGSVTQLDSMEISWKDGSPLSYDVSISTDGSLYRTVQRNGNAFRDGVLTARYIRLDLHQRSFYMSAYRISQTIFRLGGAELRNVTAQAESMEGHAASNALRDWGTWWESPHDLSPQTVDLGEVKDVGRVDLRWKGDDGRKGKYYDLQISTDGQNYRTVFRQTHGGLEKQSVYLFEEARYLRIIDYQNGDTLTRQGGTRFMLEGMRVHSQYPNEEKIDYDVSLAFPEFEILQGKNGSYVTGDVTFPSAKLVTFLDASLRTRPVPSNDWWQSLLINDKGHNMYLNPLVATFDDKGLWLTNPGDGYYSGGYPGNGSQTIDQDVHDLRIGYAGLKDETQVRVTGYDDYSISAVMTDDSDVDKMTVYLSQGALYGYFFFAEPDKAVISAENLLAVYDLQGNILERGTYTGEGVIVCVRTHSGYVGGTPNGDNREYEERFYVLNTPQNTQVVRAEDGLHLLMTEGNYLSVGAMSGVVTISQNQANEAEPHGTPDPAEVALLHEHGYAFVIGTRVSYTFNEETNAVLTEYRLQTMNVRGTAEAYSAYLPHQYKKAEDDLKKSYAYAGVHGELRGHVGNAYETCDRFYGIVPQFTEPTDDGYSAATLLSLLNTLYESNGGDKPPQNCNLINGDPYWQGKNLHPMSMAVIAADQLGAIELRDKFLEKIRYVLTDWFTYTEGNEPNGAYFYYDSEWGTLYYKNSEFGAGVNLADHHFTYGYFTLAAGVLCAYDPSFAEEYGDMVELLMRDYMNPSREDEMFPFMRNYDVFAGHGWAGGYADNNAGNNQESAGEALNSWVGAYLYATAVGNETYRRMAICGFTTELAAVKQYWLNYDGDSFGEFYPYGGIGQLYGATNFLGTFFNGEPLYAYGIHMIPGEEFLTSYALGADERESLRNVIESMRREQAAWNVSDDHKEIYGWQHIFLPMVAAYDADEAIGWYEELLSTQGNIGNDGEQFNVYSILHALKSLGTRTKTYWAENGASATVYEKDGVFTALCWNPTGETQEVVFRSEKGIAGRAYVPAHSFVSCDPTAVTEKFNRYVDCGALKVSDFSVGENAALDGGALRFDRGRAEYRVTFGSIQKYRRLILTGEGSFTVKLDRTSLPLIKTANGYESAPISLTFKHTLLVEGSGRLAALHWEELTLRRVSGNATLTASSENGGNRAAHAMDGNTGTRWESKQGSDDEWLLISLEEVVTIYQLRIIWEAASAREYKVYFSETGEDESYVEVFHGEFMGGARTDAVTPTAPMRAKYIRIVGISRTTQYGYSIFETEILTI